MDGYTYITQIDLGPTIYIYTHRCMFFTHSILINVSASAFIYDLMCITMHTVTSMPFTDAEHA